MSFLERIKMFFLWLLEMLKKSPPDLEPKPEPEPKPAEPAVPPVSEPTAPVPPPADVPTPIKTYRKGNTGPTVEKIQKRLVELGYVVLVDGEYGDETTGAVIEFQRVNGIGKTGAVGPQTWGVLFSDKALKAPAKGSLAAIARAEGLKNLTWTGMDCEAEKYLKPMRGALGMPSGRFSWCAAFVYWCCKQAGVELPILLDGGLTIAYVPAVVDWAKAEKKWRKPEIDPEPGWGIVFDWDADSMGDHIGIVISYVPGSAIITTAEGNTSSESNSNGNQTAIRERNFGSVLGFIAL